MLADSRLAGSLKNCVLRYSAEKLSEIDTMGEPGQSELAQVRTDLAEDRTVLAHERSFAGWLRTGLACIGIGLGFHALFEAMHPAWVAKGIATAFLLIGAFISISAERRARRILQRLDAHEVATLKPIRIRLLSWSMVSATAALAAAIWLLVPANAG